MKTKNKSQRARRNLSFIGIFMIMLVLSMPFYSAQALAVSVKITKNTGQAEIPSYLNSAGDVWTVEATVANLETTEVTPEQMQVNVEGSTEYFDSCSSTAGGYLCQYVSDLSSGVAEATFELKVKHLPSGAGDGASISSDGSAPTISFTQFQQREGEVLLDFTATDQPNFGVGLAKVEIIDAETGSVLETHIPEAGRKSFNYKVDGISGGKLQVPSFLTGEGTRRLKIRAEDRFGHSATSVSRLLSVDFIAPDALNISFTSLGDFVGAIRLRTLMVVYVKESNTLTEVTATSDQVEFAHPTVNCVSLPERDNVPESENLWKCTWDVVEVTPGESVSVTVHSKDEFGNEQEKVLTKGFTSDTSPPVVEFFGTDKQYQGNSYVKNGENTVFLRIAETGVGMDVSGIRANLGALGGGIDVAPTDDIWHCAQVGNVFACNWTVTGTSIAGIQSARISLNRLQDKVGNAGDLVSSVRDLLVDTGEPKVEELELFGVGADGREKEYFQSGDRLLLKVKIAEPRSGFSVKVNLNNVVNDAETLSPAGLFSEAGWEVFSSEGGSCVMRESRSTSSSTSGQEYWECSFLSSHQFKSGYQPSALIELEVEDSAGNKASVFPSEKNERARKSSEREGRAVYTFEKLGVKDEATPDYWSVFSGYPKLLLPFVDLDIVELTPARLPVEVRLKSDTSQIKAVEVNLIDCTPAPVPPAEEGEVEVRLAPALSRSLLYGGVSTDGESSPTVNVLLEFTPFNGREHFAIGPKDTTETETFIDVTADYICRLNIFTKIGSEALSYAEVQEVPVTAVFAFSALGSQDEALEELIKEEREAAQHTLWEVISTLNDFVRVVGYIGSIVQVGVKVWNLINALKGIKDFTLPLDWFPGVKTASDLECFGFNAQLGAMDDAMTPINKIFNLLNCNSPSYLWDSWWTSILDIYNFELGRAIDFSCSKVVGGEKQNVCGSRPGKSIQDNLFLSVIGVCIPGILKNVEKLREIQCRQIYCLETEVKNGLATVSSCQRLESTLICKFVVGEGWYLFPFSQVYDQVIGVLQEALKNPLTGTHTITILGCGAWCLSEGGGAISTLCNWIGFIWDVIDGVEQGIGSVTGLINEFEDGGVSYCDSVLGDEEEEETPPAEESAEESATSETAAVAG